MEKEFYQDINKVLHNDEDLFDTVEEIEYDDYETTGDFDYE
jgi:hypothetical protein